MINTLVKMKVKYICSTDEEEMSELLEMTFKKKNL